MKSLNPFKVNRKKYIDQMLGTRLIGYTNQYAEKASFDDVAWKYTYPDGISINLFFHDKTKTGTTKKVTLKSTQDIWKLEESKRHLLMAYAIDTIPTKLSKISKQHRLIFARNFLSEHHYSLHNLTQEQLDKVFDTLNSTSAPRLKPFISWLKGKSFIPPHIELKSTKGEIDLYDELGKIASKIPDNNVLLALGAIFYDTIPPDETMWQISPLLNQRNVFICAMSALAMASPNRVAAEQIVLTNQYIKDVKLESGDCIHWLDWQGSKGYKDHQNHLLANMIEPLNRALKYIRQITEPARVLARFYETPLMPLKLLLGEFQPEPSRLTKSRVNMKKPVHLIQLGYLLGFYKENSELSVPKETPDAFPLSNSQYWRKKVYQFSKVDYISLSEWTTSERVMGVFLKKTDIHTIFGDKMDGTMVKIGDLQNCWIKYIKKTIPTFPFTHASGSNKCKFSSMMFAFLGRQVALTGSGVIGQRSFYHLTQGLQLSNLLSIKLSNRQPPSIFEEFGFSKKFKITPNQFRHWLNDTGDRGGIAHRILNLWSGRQSPEQILNYIHSTEGERANVIRDILFNDEKLDEDNIRSIKVYSQSEYEALTGIGDGISSATSTGFCIQNLLTSPCEYMNDFETQCSLCSHACHVKGDKEALDLLKKDCEYQTKRLAIIKSKPNFSQSKGMKDWFKVHYRNTALLKELVGLMEDPEIKDGSVIRVIASKSEIHITDLNLKLVDKRKLSLACAKSALEQIIDDINSSKSDDDDTLNNLLAMIPEAE